jgi:hypothetical protein
MNNLTNFPQHEVVKEKLTGIKWVCYGRARLETRRPPQLLGAEVYGVDATPNGFVVLHDIYDLNGNRHSVVEEITRDYKILWSKVDLVPPPTSYCSVVYNWETGRVLLCNQRKVVEYDPRADKVTLELTEFKGIGPFKLVQTATYEYESPPMYHGPPYGAKYTGNIWIVDRDAHFIALVDRSGNVLYSFGTYGTAGNGLNLRYPYWAEGSGNRCLIADSGNCRVFAYDFVNKRFAWVWAYPSPRCHRLLYGDKYLVLPFRGGAPGVVVKGSIIEYATPFPLIESMGAFTSENTLVVCSHTNIYEFDVGAAVQPLRRPIMPISLAGQPLDANQSLEARLGYPLVVWADPFEELRIEVLSTQAATLNIYRLKTVHGGMYPFPSFWAQPDANGNLQWDLYDSVSLRAGKLVTYPLDCSGVWRVDVIMGSSPGSIDLRLLLK